MRHVWTIGLAAAVVAGLVLSAGVAVGQVQELQPMTISIPIDTQLWGKPGDRFLVASERLPEGINCAGVLKTNNNHSDHPGTNIIMVSATTATVFDVEVVGYAARSLALRSGVFESNGSVDVFVQIGEDGSSSTGFDLVIDCAGIPGTTTTTSTVPPTTDTTQPPPVTTSSSIPVGVPSGVGPVGVSVPWLPIVGVWVLGGVLAWAFIRGATRKNGSDE